MQKTKKLSFQTRASGQHQTNKEDVASSLSYKSIVRLKKEINMHTDKREQ